MVLTTCIMDFVLPQNFLLGAPKSQVKSIDSYNNFHDLVLLTSWLSSSPTSASFRIKNSCFVCNRWLSQQRLTYKNINPRFNPQAEYL